MNLTINDMLTIVVTSWHRKHICIHEKVAKACGGGNGGSGNDGGGGRGGGSVGGGCARSFAETIYRAGAIIPNERSLMAEFPFWWCMSSATGRRCVYASYTLRMS